MRASKLLAEKDASVAADNLPSIWPMSIQRQILVCLATTQAAVEQLARESSTGTERAIKAILDNKTEGRT